MGPPRTLDPPRTGVPIFLASRRLGQPGQRASWPSQASQACQAASQGQPARASHTQGARSQPAGISQGQPGPARASQGQPGPGPARASIVISENLPRRTGLAANAVAKGFEWRGIWASIVISENLPRRTGLSANAGPGSNYEWTPGGRGWEAEAGELGGRGRGAGRQELGGRQERSACLTTGLPGYGQGCSPRLWCCNTISWPKKETVLGEVFARI